MVMKFLLVFVPVGILLAVFHAPPLLVFAAAALAIVPLAGLMGDATDQLSETLGPTWGGLLNATLGNAPEIIISVFALRQGLEGIVKASLTGSIIGNLLFGLGLAMLFGGLKHGTQKFSQSLAQINSSLLTLAAFGLIVPAVFSVGSIGVTREMSVEIACVLFLVYTASLVYTFVTNRPALGEAVVEAEPSAKHKHERDEPRWGRNKALGVLGLVTLALAGMSEILTDALEPASELLHLNPVFSGVFLLAVVGNAAELSNALRFARADKMDVSVGITVGASIQVALVVAPVLVFAGQLMGREMNLLFTNAEILAIVLAVYVTRNITTDGESNWLEGLMLVAVYFILAFGFYYLPVPSSPRV